MEGSPNARFRVHVAAVNQPTDLIEVIQFGVAGSSKLVSSRGGRERK